MLVTNFKILKEKELFSVWNSPDKHKILTKKLGRVKQYGLETPITLLQILDLLGFDAALRILDNAIIPEQTKEAELFAMQLKADFAELVLHIFERKYPDNNKPRRAIEIARKYVVGEATEEELEAAREDAEAVAKTAEVAWAAAGAAAGAVAGAARVAAEAHRVARVAWADAGVTAMAATEAAGDKAYNAERREQEKILRKYLEGME